MRGVGDKTVNSGVMTGRVRVLSNGRGKRVKKWMGEKIKRHSNRLEHEGTKKARTGGKRAGHGKNYVGAGTGRHKGERDEKQVDTKGGDEERGELRKKWGVWKGKLNRVLRSTSKTTGDLWWRSKGK